jgi:dynein heavy chain
LLGEEGHRWEENILKLNEVEVFFAGNVFLAAATLSYLGPFNGQFRDNLIDSWKRFAREYEF